MQHRAFLCQTWSHPARRRAGLRRVAALTMMAALAAGGALAQATDASEATKSGSAAQASPPFEPMVGQPGKDVVWVPTPDDVVDRMLDMAQVTGKDFVVDLGSGDGKIAIAAAKRGARARGIEFNPDMVELSRRNAKAAGVRNVEFQQGDIFKSNFSSADVVTLYLMPHLNERLRPILLAMKPGTRVASHQFTMGDWKPDETANINGRIAMFWRVPAQVGGAWTVRIADGGADDPPVKLHLRQHYQELEGDATVAADDVVRLQDPKLSGANISFTVAAASGSARHFEGTADHKGRMMGTVTTEGSGQRRRFSAVRQ
jgi:SAM-dependent methyltransferase